MSKFVFLMLLLFSCSAYACSCKSFDFKLKFEKADYVYIGIVNSQEKESKIFKDESDIDYLIYQSDIVEILKGVPKTDLIHAIMLCPNTLALGKKFLVFGNSNETPWMNVCTPTGTTNEEHINGVRLLTNKALKRN